MLPETALWLAVGLFGILAGCEFVRPARNSDYRRWPLNISLGLLGLVLVRLLAVLAALGAAFWAQGRGIGLLNMVPFPAVAAGVTTVIALDLSVYWQHRAFHTVPWLWRWHRLHHTDENLDVSTGLRFHPVEAGLSMIWKSTAAVALGAPVWAIVIFELWLMAGSLFEHANIRLGGPLDRMIRTVLVTPDMHRVHHSAHEDDANHNFSFAISIWDLIFGTYRAVPSGPRIGIANA
jgi:sterol desaturase/sphingolipid hydroxylase (fatty acid hydroxylase superfamily)